MAAKKILVVDDEETSIKIIKKAIEAEGHDLLEAYTGQETLDKIRGHMPDLVLMDIVLPDIDGAEVVKALLDNPRFEKIKVIFISSLAVEPENPGMSKTTLKVGAQYFPAFPKPFHPSELVAEVRAVLGQ